MTYKPEYDKKTTVQDRAAKYAFGITAWSGEPLLAIQGAAMSAYVEGYRDRDQELQREPSEAQAAPVVSDAMREQAARNYAATKWPFFATDALHQEHYSIAFEAYLAAVRAEPEQREEPV